MIMFLHLQKPIVLKPMIPTLPNHQRNRHYIWAYAQTAETGKPANIQSQTVEFGIARSTAKMKRSFYYNTDIFER